MTGALGRSIEFAAPDSDSGARSESNARSIMTGPVVADWDLGSGRALIEIGADSVLRRIQSLDDTRFCESTSPPSNHRWSTQEPRHWLAQTYVSPQFRTVRRLRVCPYKSIACRLSHHLTWLPNKHDLSIWWAIQVHPAHRSNLPDDPWSLNQVLNGNVEVHLW